MAHPGGALAHPVVAGTWR